MVKQQLNLGFGLTWSTLQTVGGLEKLDHVFLADLRAENPSLVDHLLAYRSGTELSEDEPKFLIALAMHLEHFLCRLFPIEGAYQNAQASWHAHEPILWFKQAFIKQRAQKKIKQSVSLPPFSTLNQWLQSQLPQTYEDEELTVAIWANKLLKALEDPDNQRHLDSMVQWCVQALATPDGQHYVSNWVSFRLPEALDFQNLLSLTSPSSPSKPLQAQKDHIQDRDGFDLTDQRMSQVEVLGEANYCVHCHQKSATDFCRTGFPIKKKDPEQGYKKNALDELLVGCPVDERISEMQLLKKDGFALAALAMITRDNPMCAVTGHRICNDCMKSCIYQKQTPVNIPQVETGVLTDILNLPWGVEIYLLLMRWNPLRNVQYLPEKKGDYKVLVVGMGPSGFSLAYHLLMEGCHVVGIDGAKIEPLEPALVNQPIYQYQSIKKPLSERVMAGFGGVAEYGITARWDKNFLQLIYIALMRHQRFQLFGATRFGGGITIEKAWELGFDHIAMAMGAGLPKAMNIPHSMAAGMRQANDFLMALQLTGAAKKDSLALLQVRLPAVVIGSGLTAVDTATELQAYYIKQVEKTYYFYQSIKKTLSEAQIRKYFDQASWTILQTQIAHGALVAARRAKDPNPQWHDLLSAWGGVSIVYRKSMQQSPAYRLNYEELTEAMKEGIVYYQNYQPLRVEVDVHGHVNALVCSHTVEKSGIWEQTAVVRQFPAKSIWVATGASPNVAYSYEHAGLFVKNKGAYQAYEMNTEAKQLDLQPAPQSHHCKDQHHGPFTNYNQHDRRITFIGDMHPKFHGNVVKAIASAKATYPHIMRQLKAQKIQVFRQQAWYQQLNAAMNMTVHAVRDVHPDIVELVVRAPLAAAVYLPGQMFRLQLYKSQVPRIDGVAYTTECVTLTPFDCDKESGLLKFWLIKSHVPEKILALGLKQHQSIACMGPTGVRTKIPAFQGSGETLLLTADAKGLAQVASVAKALQNQGHRVWLWLQLPDASWSFCHEILQEHSAVIYYDYSSDKPDFSQPMWALDQIDRFLCLGGHDWVLQCLAWYHSNQELMQAALPVIASVHGPMQCMLKGVCAQCFQWQVDPHSGERTKAVFACSWQDQPAEFIDQSHLKQRHDMNKMQRQLIDLWFSLV